MDFPDKSRDFQEETFSSPLRLRQVYAQQKTALSDHIDSIFKMLLYQIKAQRDMRERSPQQIAEMDRLWLQVAIERTARELSRDLRHGGSEKLAISRRT